ncbi:NAD(P)-dependent dehydrogenase (short-subunit alcohol dehydrogenase family) [Nocardia kruczakiae]|uniref:NAD(P)-dependent dehydrogenase (Short-subunit alcohol dehydrogenase family) n=1 Tax=Nocardia kruczakiae TaxID=261477 RepID=A0ABU1XPI5_9NOCA|nr:SDR family oxidoreductase [Nocardia kruczakiae]MDR7172434.1 NAD(P)-dependent dehydrogenase (short-subunit alcohol dehydrogenase family) [Nocardia kruczakiae]
MGVYVVTGAASGMGRAAAQKLRERGHTVVGVDLRDAQVVADLSTPAGRRTAIDGALAQVDGHLDGAILAAGVGPAPGADRPRLIFEVNYRGVVDLLDGWRSALARADEAKVVVFGSNSTTTTPLVPRRAIRALLAGDTEKALRALRIFGRNAPSIAYGTSKIAVSHWVRRQATTAQWAGAGIRLNALAPGAVLTPLLEKQLATAAEAKNIERFPVPIGGFGDPGDLAEWAVFMLSPAARFLCGSIVFVDGGSDAYFRAGDWPRAVPLRKLPGYLWRFFGSGPR